jgi:hypothetical protein
MISSVSARGIHRRTDAVGVCERRIAVGGAGCGLGCLLVNNGAGRRRAAERVGERRQMRLLELCGMCQNAYGDNGRGAGLRTLGELPRHGGSGSTVSRCYAEEASPVCGRWRREASGSGETGRANGVGEEGGKGGSEKQRCSGPEVLCIGAGRVASDCRDAQGVHF